MKFGSWTYGGKEVDLRHPVSENSTKQKADRLSPNGKEEYEWIVEEGMSFLRMVATEAILHISGVP
jgi:hypothetical protein